MIFLLLNFSCSSHNWPLFLSSFLNSLSHNSSSRPSLYSLLSHNPSLCCQTSSPYFQTSSLYFQTSFLCCQIFFPCCQICRICRRSVSRQICRQICHQSVLREIQTLNLRRILSNLLLDLKSFIFAYNAARCRVTEWLFTKCRFHKLFCPLRLSLLNCAKFYATKSFSKVGHRVQTAL